MEQILASLVSALVSPDAIGVYKVLGITAAFIALIPAGYYFEKYFILPNAPAKAEAEEKAIEDAAEKKLMEQGIVPSWRETV